jgi:hypothetical protein
MNVSDHYKIQWEILDNHNDAEAWNAKQTGAKKRG